MKYEINIVGCDDQTCFNMDLDKAEFKILNLLAELSAKESSSNCMPVVKVDVFNEDESEEDDDC